MFNIISHQFSSVQFSRSVVSDSLRPHELQHARPSCPSPTPGVYTNSSSSSRWCHPAISSSVVPFSSCPQSLPASGSFPMSQLFTWGGQSIGVSASVSVLPMNTQGWSPLGWTGWISLQSSGKCKSKQQCDITWYLPEWLASKRTQITSLRKGMEKREPLYTVGGNVNWCNHYGEQYGGFSKELKIELLCMYVVQVSSRSVVSNSLQPHGLYLPGSSVHGILQARILEWVAIHFSRGSSQLWDQTQISHIAGRFFTLWATREASTWTAIRSSNSTPRYMSKNNKNHLERYLYPNVHKDTPCLLTIGFLRFIHFVA